MTAGTVPHSPAGTVSHSRCARAPAVGPLVPAEGSQPHIGRAANLVGRAACRARTAGSCGSRRTRPRSSRPVGRPPHWVRSGNRGGGSHGEEHEASSRVMLGLACFPHLAWNANSVNTAQECGTRWPVSRRGNVLRGRSRQSRARTRIPSWNVCRCTCTSPGISWLGTSTTRRP